MQTLAIVVEIFDAIVIGSGFGGLGAALELAEQGQRVALLESLNYPGGCASTVKRGAYSFEAGATLFSGFGENQQMRKWIDRYQMPVELDWLDPMIDLRTPDWQLPISTRREQLVENFSKMPGAPREKLQSFFERQRKVADTLWALFDDPKLLPPVTIASLLKHVGRSPRYLPLLPLIGRSMMDVVRQEGLEDFEPLKVYLDALCQITVQVSAEDAEAPFALAATDYCFRGTAHIRGGVGVLARALCNTIDDLGGSVHFAHRVKMIEHQSGGWVVTTRKGEFTAPTVIANLLPQSLLALTKNPTRSLKKKLQASAKRVEGGWGAAMLYLGIDAAAISNDSAHHFELIADTSLPFMKGNHIFCSASDRRETERAPEGQRTMTVSTHVPMPELMALPQDEQAAYISQIQSSMRDTLRTIAPELYKAVLFEMTASPRTFERFTQRPHGYVGGVPRRVGLKNYQGIFPTELMPGLFMVGDSTFPGQSTLATAIGGMRTAQAALGRN